MSKHQPISVEILDEAGMWRLLSPPERLRRTMLQLPRPRHVGVSVMAAVLAVSLHLMLFGVIFGTAGRPVHKPMPDADGAAASALHSQSGEWMTVLMLINEHGISAPDDGDMQLADLIPPPSPVSKETLKLTGSLQSSAPPSVPVAGSESGTDEQSPTAEATGNGAGRALMFGRYMNQVKARIERAWTYPVAGQAGRFQCRAQIRQDKAGQVKEVTLQRCDADAAWQMSLVQAIQQAAPLSAPPDESVFSEMITLNFDVELAVVSAN